MTFQEAATKLTGRNHESRKVANNTYLQRRGEEIVLRLHATDIMVFHINGYVTLFTGGWRTVTTKARLNDFLPYGWRISQSKGQWYIGQGREDVALFAEGVELGPDGAIAGAESLAAVTEKIALRKQVKKYSKDYIKAFKAGKVPAPSTGDCWGCLMVEVKTHKTAMGGPDHIKSHLAEKYYVPSLLVRAMESFPTSPAMKMLVSVVWFGEGIQAIVGMDFVYDQLATNIYRYCLRELGQAS